MTDAALRSALAQLRQDHDPVRNRRVAAGPYVALSDVLALLGEPVELSRGDGPPDVALRAAAQELADAAFDYHIHSELLDQRATADPTVRLLLARGAVLTLLGDPAWTADPVVPPPASKTDREHVEACASGEEESYIVMQCPHIAGQHGAEYPSLSEVPGVWLCTCGSAHVFRVQDAEVLFREAAAETVVPTHADVTSVRARLRAMADAMAWASMGSLAEPAQASVLMDTWAKELDAVLTRLSTDLTHDERDVLLAAVRLGLTALQQHERWCGFKADAPGDPVCRHAEEALKYAITLLAARVVPAVLVQEKADQDQSLPNGSRSDLRPGEQRQDPRVNLNETAAGDREGLLAELFNALHAVTLMIAVGWIPPDDVDDYTAEGVWQMACEAFRDSAAYDAARAAIAKAEGTVAAAEPVSGSPSQSVLGAANTNALDLSSLPPGPGVIAEPQQETP